MTTASAPSPPRLRDLAVWPVVAVARTTSLEDAARTMRDQEVGCLIVAEPGERIAVVTERDLVSVLAAGHGRGVDVGVLADGDPLTMPADAGVLDAAMAMLGSGARYVVVTHDGHAVGVVSMRDVLTALVEAVVPERLFLIAARRTSGGG